VIRQEVAGREEATGSDKLAPERESARHSDSRRSAIAVVGAGAAGLTAALRAAETGARVVLLNAHPRIGLKLLMSGGTRCNVTHREVSERDFHGGSRAVIARVLRAFPPEQTRRWMESLGVPLKLEGTGKYFPVTDDAHTVLDALVAAVRRAGVDVLAGARVVRLERSATGGFRLGIQPVANSNAFSDTVAARATEAYPLPAVEPSRWIVADRVILASGGLSFPRTGSDGTGYALATGLGHSLVPPIPALVPLTAEDPLCRTLQGIAIDGRLTLRSGGKRIPDVRGSLLFTHFGLSGPAALDLSRHWLRARGEHRAIEVRASFLPDESPESLLGAWRAAASSESTFTIRRLVGGRIPERMLEALCAEAGVESGERLSQVDRARRSCLVSLVTERPLAVTGTLGYEKAEVTAGGVPLSEVDPSTLESRIVPGLFLCGEILDVEGRLGGFNFQWAWSSGTVAGRAAARVRGEGTAGQITDPRSR
jgi:hypothetical protein